MFTRNKLKVYEKALALSVSSEELCSLRQHAVVDHFHRASESIILSIAEGARLQSGPAKVKRLDYAIGSTLEFRPDYCHAERFLSRSLTCLTSRSDDGLLDWPIIAPAQPMRASPKLVEVRSERLGAGQDAVDVKPRTGLGDGSSGRLRRKDNLRKPNEARCKHVGHVGRSICKPGFILIQSRLVEPRQAIGPFQIVSLLGRGGMGEVFLATKTRLDRKVAIEVLRRS